MLFGKLLFLFLQNDERAKYMTRIEGLTLSEVVLCRLHGFQSHVCLP